MTKILKFVGLLAVMGLIATYFKSGSLLCCIVILAALWKLVND